MASQTTIELNGKLYDAHSGKFIKALQNTAKPVQRAANRMVSMDGVHRPVTQAQRPIQKQVAATPKPAKKAHTVAKSAHKVHTRTQKALTLNRRAVKKPAKKLSSVSTPVATAKPQPATTLRRELLARHVQKSDHISRFSRKAAPVATEAKSKVAKVETPTPVKKHTSVEPSVITKKEELLSKGLKNAHSHTERPTSKKPRTKKRRVFKWGATAAAVLLVAGYTMYLNLPNLKMKVAASRAGFSANLPSYNPSGYRLSGPIDYSPGQITVGYNSTTDNRNFSITQKESNWDSESLLSNYVNQQNGYQTQRTRGLTIYLYGESNATWVSGGVWYTIEGQSGLSPDQISKIASSM